MKYSDSCVTVKKKLLIQHKGLFVLNVVIGPLHTYAWLAAVIRQNLLSKMTQFIDKLCYANILQNAKKKIIYKSIAS